MSWNRTTSSSLCFHKLTQTPGCTVYPSSIPLTLLGVAIIITIQKFSLVWCGVHTTNEESLGQQQLPFIFNGNLSYAFSTPRERDKRTPAGRQGKGENSSTSCKHPSWQFSQSQAGSSGFQQKLSDKQSQFITWYELILNKTRKRKGWLFCVSKA